eukprot:scaffold614_cov367-Prasinococcus_capsulatus_cf.AAC.13
MVTRVSQDILQRSHAGTYSHHCNATQQLSDSPPTNRALSGEMLRPLAFPCIHPPVRATRSRFAGYGEKLGSHCHDSQRLQVFVTGTISPYLLISPSLP